MVALDGRAAARSVIAFLSGSSAAPQPVAVLAEDPLRWVSPGRVGPGAPPPPSGRFTGWAQRFAPRSRLAVSQDGRVLWTGRRGTVVPNRALHLPAGWLGAVDPRGGPVRVGVR